MSQELIKAKDFNKKSPEYRIEAVIHDGQWITIDKWAKSAKVKEDDIIKYIEKNSNILIAFQESFRVSGEEVINWHKRNNIELGTSIVPKNFPPKIYKGKSEVEWIYEEKRFFVSFLYIKGNNSDVFDKIKDIAKFYGTFKENSSTQISIRCLDPFILKEKILNSLTEEEIESIKITSYKNALRRSFSDLPEDLKEVFIIDYINYARNSLKGHKSTLSMFLGKQEEIDSQIVTWIIEAYNKFDEEKNVPFSAYLHQVLQRWPYNLFVEVMGTELDKFIRHFKREEEALSQENDGQIDLSDIHKKMPDYSREDFLSLYEQMLNWESSTLANISDSDLIIDKGKPIGKRVLTKDDLISSYNILLNILEAGIESKDSESAFILLARLSKGKELTEESINKLSEKYLEILWEKYSKIVQH